MDMQLFARALGPEGNTNLKTLKIGGNKVVNISELAAALAKNKSLIYLDLSGNEVGDAGADQLAAALKENTILETLVLGKRRYGNKVTNVVKLAAALAENKSLTDLDLSGNAVDDAGAKHLGTALEKNKNLKRLGLGFQTGRSLIWGLHSVAWALRSNRTLTTLDVSNIRGDDLGGYFYSNCAEALDPFEDNWRELKYNPILSTLLLGGRSRPLDPMDVGKLSRMLEQNVGLTCLDLHHVYMEDIGVESLAAALQKNQNTLTKLDLSWNQVREAGALKLAAALKDNTILSTLLLNKNQVTAHGGTKLAEAVLQRATMNTVLDLSENPFDEAAMQKLQVLVREIAEAGCGCLTLVHAGMIRPGG